MLENPADQQSIQSERKSSHKIHPCGAMSDIYLATEGTVHGCCCCCCTVLLHILKISPISGLELRDSSDGSADLWFQSNVVELPVTTYIWLLPKLQINNLIASNYRLHFIAYVLTCIVQLSNGLASTSTTSRVPSLCSIDLTINNNRQLCSWNVTVLCFGAPWSSGKGIMCLSSTFTIKLTNNYRYVLSTYRNWPPAIDRVLTCVEA